MKLPLFFAHFVLLSITPYGICTQATSFWNEFQEWYSFLSNMNLILSELDVMFGIIRCQNYCLALKHLIILAKYFIYVNALNTSKYRLNDFISHV